MRSHSQALGIGSEHIFNTANTREPGLLSTKDQLCVSPNSIQSNKGRVNLETSLLAASFVSFLILNLRNSHSSERPSQQSFFSELPAERPCELPTHCCTRHSVRVHTCSGVLRLSATHLKWFCCSFLCALFAPSAEAWPSETLRILHTTSFFYSASHFGS